MRGSQRAQLLLAAVLMLFATDGGEAKTVTYNWTVSYVLQAPDCVGRLVMGINGESPGPLIRATEGDTVVVNMTNGMPTEGVVMHWHGILQEGTPWADGAAYVSQCPINPGETYTYIFNVTHAGTYFYHGHYGMQRAAGFYGSLIVDLPDGEKEPFYYDGELSIVLNDWWHTSTFDQELGLDSIPFRWIGEPQSLLIQGRGKYDCSLVPTGGTANSGDSVSCNATSEQCTPFDLPVEPGLTYRLRITSVASLSALNFILEGHNMTVVEVSGFYVDPVVVQNLDVYTGEAYSVTFIADQDKTRNYWAAVNVRGREPKTPPGLAVLNYLNNSDLPTTDAPVSPLWSNYTLSVENAEAYKTLAGYEESLPTDPSRTLFLLNTQNTYRYHVKWAINNISYVPTSVPVLGTLKYKGIEALGPVPPDKYTVGYNISSLPSTNETTVGSGVYVFNLNETVDVCIQNAIPLNGHSEIHPWHLHGHDFWVLGYGNGVFDESTDYDTLNYVNPPKMNTASVYPDGWTYLRFVANNPGAWPFHCHIEPHFHMGMGVIFAEGVDSLPDIPEETLVCGGTQFLNP
ncbi:unnamed protein product [Calypogeia fissa]